MSIKVDLAYVDVCLPDYFKGDSRPWVCVYPTKVGYTSRELREAILSEFNLGAIGGNVNFEAIPEELYTVFEKKLKACLNKSLKYRGKKLKYSEFDIEIEDDGEIDVSPLLHVVFNVEGLENE